MNGEAHEEVTTQEPAMEPVVNTLQDGGDPPDSGGPKTDKSIPADDEEDCG